MTEDTPPGSLLFFYQTAPHSAIYTLGIVEKARRLGDLEGVANAIGKRSVYSLKEVDEMIRKKGEILVINFRFIRHFSIPPNLDDLTKRGVLKGAPQSIMKLEERSYQSLKTLLAGE